MKQYLTNIKPRPSKRWGELKPYGIFHADLEKNKSIRIYGTYQNKDFNKTFNINDIAEYDSYNLIYTGKIVGITEKTITIQYGDDIHRLELHEFIWRNWNFDKEKVSRHNAEEMMCI